ncbi:hypothetical protein FAM09_11515 [Niastella caeni]|uniref:Uncharacterized protein n=1 Tax=Niastella caeni TaxID=2569763 RepID=A0A4S8HYR2_9BACT|nr:hypothetical protein [Niastella caeni]THU40481.1 hypothetical protein FAM09_11515 [Niastella caeni]
MNDSKIQIKVGNVEFSGEGDQIWLTSQLDKILEKVPELIKIEPKTFNGISRIGDEANGNVISNGSRSSTLATFLKENNATVHQVKKYLATAAFLQLNGKNRLSTSDVVEALKNANQSRLGNPSDCLNQNVKKGHCEKDGGKEFFVTADGFRELGLEV